MKLKTILEQNHVSSFDVASDVVLNVILTDNRGFSLSTDTSKLMFGTPLQRINEFQLNGDILTVGGISINADEIEVRDLTEEMLTNPEVNPRRQPRRPNRD